MFHSRGKTLCCDGEQQRVPAAKVTMADDNELLLELWEYVEDGMSLSILCYAGPLGNAARETLPTDAKLVWSVWATNHFEAMTRYYQRQEWGAYTTDQAWDFEPYPTEWIDEQRRFFAAYPAWEREINS